MIEIHPKVLVETLQKTIEGIRTYQKLLPNTENDVSTYQKIESSNKTIKELQKLINELTGESK